MLQSVLITTFSAVHATNIGARSRHARDLRLSESIDGLLRIPHQADGGVPCAPWRLGFVVRCGTGSPQTSEETVLARAGVLEFIDDEGSMTATDAVEDSDAVLQLLLDPRVIPSEIPCPDQVIIPPRILR